MINLGDKVKDKITGFEGIVISKVIHINGCVRYEVKPQVLKDGKTIESEWIDEKQITVKSKVKERKVEEDKPGGPGTIPSGYGRPPD